MGLVLGCLTSSITSLGCCFTQAACRMCCNSCPTAKYSTATRIGYAVTMFVGVIFSYLTKAGFVKNLLVKIPTLCHNVETSECMKIISQETIIRIWMTYAIFFMFMSIVTIDVKNSRDIRAMFHTGFWIFKLLMLIGISTGLAFVDVTSLFSYVSVILGFIGTMVFLLIQLILIIDVVYTWNSSWTSKAEDTSSNAWYGGLFTFTTLMYMGTLAAIISMFILLAKSNTEACHAPKFLISIQLLSCIIISIIAVLPSVQDNIPSSGLLQASAISIYTSYQLFSALLNNPSSCNNFPKSTSTINIVISVLSTLFTLLMITFTSLKNEDYTKTQMLGIQGSDGADTGVIGMEDKRDVSYGAGRAAQEVYDDEECVVSYSYSLFHVMLLMCSLYVMMVLTNWYIPKTYISGDVVSTWIRVTTSWLCHILYVWTLVAPLVLSDRDFGYD